MKEEDIMSDKRFFLYLIDKIKKNKDIISVIISACILMQAILFIALDKNMQTIFTENYIVFVSFAIIFIIIVFAGILLYLRSDQLQESYNEFENVDILNCSKRKGMLLCPEEYQKKMQIFLLPDLEEIEKSVGDNDQIWVLTSDVKLETTISTISKIMEANLDRGVKYKYYIPDTVKNSASILELKRKYSKYPNFELIKISTRYKLLFERFDVIIYLPDKNYTEGRSGFICINFSSIDSSIAFKKITEEDTKNLIGQLQHIKGV